MLIGDIDYPIAEAAIFFVLIISLIFNSFLFNRGQGNYSIKYELMRNNEFFRKNIAITYIIEAFYKFFFVLPFVLLLTLSVLAAIRDLNNLAPILINGLIILLILYPIKTSFFYYRLFLIWLLSIGSELSTFFIYERNGEQAYLILSSIFYTANVLFFYLALISMESTYFEMSQAIAATKDEVMQINSRWADGQLPKIFDGGLYGWLNKNNYRYIQYLTLYITSLLFLIGYAIIVRYILDSSLGYVGLISTIIYDIFIQIFNALDNDAKSTKTVYYVLIISRLLSFVFGIQNWIIGYCVLYFFVSVFVGWIVIDKHLPVKKKQVVKDGGKGAVKFLNALKTPEFVLLVLTVEIIVMILVEAYALNETADPTIVYNNVTIPMWQWGILVLVAAWVVIIYMISARVFIRYKFRIFNQVQYYFGFQQLTQYHLYILLSYLLLIGLGLYSYLYLNEPIAFVSFIFLPLLMVCLFGILVSWQKNHYSILSDIEQYNKEMGKRFQIQKQRNQLIKNNEKLQNYKKQMMLANFRMKNTGSGNNFFGRTSLRDIIDKQANPDKLQEADVIIDDSLIKAENSGINIISIPSVLDRLESIKKVEGKDDEEDYQPLKDWRNPENQVTCSGMWSCFTPSDKRIIIYTVIFLVLWIGYCLASALWCNSKFGISVFVCSIVVLSTMPYAKFYLTKQDMLVKQILINWLFFAAGIAYWSIFNMQVIGPISFSIVYLLVSLYLLIRCYRTQFQAQILISPALQILLCITFIEITLCTHRTAADASVFGVIFFILVVLQIPVYYYLVYDHVPRLVIGICSGIIGGVIVVVSVLGFFYQFISAFAIFAIAMGLIFVGVFFAAIAVYADRMSSLEEKPNVYSAYGEPRYYFDSSKEILKTNNTHMNLFSGAMITLVVFSVIVSIFFTDKEWSVFGLCVFWLMQFFISMQSAMSSYLTIGQYKSKGLLTDEIIKHSLTKLKNYYMSQQIAGDDSPEYERLLEQTRAKIDTNDRSDADEYKKLVQYHDLFVKNLKEEERFLFFWCALIMFNLAAKNKENIFRTLNQLRNIKEELVNNGIILESLEQRLSPEEAYEKVNTEIESLQPIDYLIYEQILENHRIQEKNKMQEAEQIRKRQEQENQKRNEQLYNNMNNMGNLSQSDQIKLFKEKLKSRKLFTDKQFPSNEDSLGELSSLVSAWKRPSSDIQQLIKGGISASDVRQGKIGDCYLVSSFAVLGEERIKYALGYEKDGKQLWINEKGGYMVKFYKFFKEVYIIIDDLLPVDENQNWVFAKSEEPNQFWPCILEKAYAKMYGGYQNIVEGKNHQVFAEFTGGFPYEIVIEKKNSNRYGLWDKIITSIKNGYLLAAGSNSSPRGNLDISKRGIVQGHAYSILNAKEVDGIKLIKLKNPHGSLGKEWKGEYSDGSPEMNKRMMSLLNHEAGVDGIFWMTFEDFVYEFNSVYFCAVFDDRWVKFGPIDGKWKADVNSFGTPDCDGIQHNYHFGIKVTKKCNFFACLSQQSISALKGKNPIFMILMKNDGKRLHKESLDLLNSVTRIQRPTNLVSISLQAELESFSYPYTFTLMISCSEAGMQGTFSLQAYCDDKNSVLIPNDKFDIQ